MSEPSDALDAIERVAKELLPKLDERLRRHGLGEIEVRHSGIRLRVAAGSTEAAASSAAPSPPHATSPRASSLRPESPPTRHEAAPHGVGAPAVGYFVYGEGLGPGLSVEKGDELGYVEMLGVRHDVRAPRRGTIRNLVAESGEAVEYGQVVLELEPVESAR